MGTLYMLVDHTRRRWFELNKFGAAIDVDWNLAPDAKALGQDLIDKALPGTAYTHTYLRELARRVCATMRPPIAVLSDTSDDEAYEYVEMSYKKVGTRLFEDPVEGDR